MDRPIFQMAEPHTSPESKSLAALASGEFDSLFKNAGDKPSALYRQTRKDPMEPVVALVQQPQFPALSYALPKYPLIARMVRAEGRVIFQFDVKSDGTVDNIKIVSGHPLLRPAVTEAVSTWVFPPEAVGQPMSGAFEFTANCKFAGQ